MPVIAWGLVAGVSALSGAVAAWWWNDDLERRGLKAPSETAPGVAVQAAGAGVAVGLMIAAGAAGVLLLKGRR